MTHSSHTLLLRPHKTVAIGSQLSPAPPGSDVSAQLGWTRGDEEGHGDADPDPDPGGDT